MISISARASSPSDTHICVNLRNLRIKLSPVRLLSFSTKFSTKFATKFREFPTLLHHFFAGVPCGRLTPDSCILSSEFCANSTKLNRSRDGSALIMALFVIVVLSMLVGSFGFEAHLEAKYASYARDRIKASQLSESGMVLAEMLMSKQSGGGTIDKPEDEDRWFDAAERLKLGQSIYGLVEPVGEGYVVLDIVPEPGRLNVNLLTDKDWETILGNIGLPDEYWEAIIDPIMDWLDEDDIANPKGAETEDYYSLLEPPYQAKNGVFDTIREMLLVKGFSETILTGGIFDPSTLEGETTSGFSTRYSRFSETNDIYIAGIEQMLTTYGDGKVNIQSAPYDVLRTLPDVDDILARAIMEEREAIEDEKPHPFASVEDLFSRIDGLNSEIAKRVTVKSQYYRITSTGRVGKVQRQIWAIAFHDGKQLRYLRWCEEP